MSRGALVLFTGFNLLWAGLTGLALLLLLLMGTGSGPEVGRFSLSRLLVEAIPFALLGPGLGAGATWMAWRMHAANKAGLTILFAVLPGAVALIGLIYILQ